MTAAFVGRRLAALQGRHLLRSLETVADGAEPWIMIGGRRLLNLSSNNYLGLASHPRVTRAAADAAVKYGSGTGSSRLIAGTSALHQALEDRLARFKGAERALVFNSGYTANLSIIPALVGPGDLVLGDQLNHASLIDGCRLSRAEFVTYPHRDATAIETLLSDVRARRRSRRVLVVTDTVFSMDGDLAPLLDIAELCQRYEAMLVVDEAHATGCIGTGGRGLVAELGLENQVTLTMGTLSKGLGSFGAFVVGQSGLIDYLVNTSRGFMFTTALPPTVIAASLAALDVLEQQPERVALVQERGRQLREGLADRGFDVLDSQTQIVPVLVGEATAALELAGALREEGVYAVAIRPPTVPPGGARVRASAMASHSKEALTHAVQAFVRARDRLSGSRVASPESQGERTTQGLSRLGTPAVGTRDTGPEAQDSGLDLERDDKRFLWHPFTQQQDWEAESPITIVEAEGHYLIDADGNRYLDGISSLWVNVHGHRRAEIDRAIADQLDRVAHSTFLGLTHPPGIRLARRLVELAPGQLSRVFYSDTGATAVEIALKMAFQYWRQRSSARPSKTKFLALCNAYHGDTVGAMSVSGIDLFHSTYEPLLFPTLRAHSAYCYRCHLGKTYPSCGVACLEEVEQVISAHAGELAAVIMEPMVQGAAGMLVYPPGYTRTVWDIARRYEVLFIADEVATGFGRTGTMFACDQEGVEPDLMAVGKGITGGYLPLAATLATEEIYRAFLGRPEEGRTLYHGHTYTANPLACAAALASLDLFEQDQTLERLQPKIGWLRDRLEHVKSLPLVGDVRQCGFMVGIELVQDKATRQAFPISERVGVRVIKEGRRRGIMLRPLGDVLVLMPPLSISQHELELLVDALEASIRAVAIEVGDA